jgi:hypothetical protein
MCDFLHIFASPHGFPIKRMSMQQLFHPAGSLRRFCMSLVLGLIGAAPLSAAGLDASRSGAERGAEVIFQSGFDERWIDVTGPDFWQCNANCSLVNGQFVEAGAGMTINPVGTWINGLRPLAVRVQASENPLLLLSVGRFGGGIEYAYCENYVVATPCPVQAAGDIQRMNLYMSGRIDRIEFLVP